MNGKKEKWQERVEKNIEVNLIKIGDEWKVDWIGKK